MFVMDFTAENITAVIVSGKVYNYELKLSLILEMLERRVY